MARVGTTKYESNKQEKRVAGELNARTVIASGSLWGSKGDVRSENYLVECKTTAKDFYTLDLNTWNKIEKEAIKDGLRIPVMNIDLLDGKHRFAVFKRGDFELKKTRVTLECDLGREVKSTRIKHSIDTVFNYVYKFNVGGIIKQLVILPWEEFLELVEVN